MAERERWRDQAKTTEVQWRGRKFTAGESRGGVEEGQERERMRDTMRLMGFVDGDGDGDGEGDGEGDVDADVDVDGDVDVDVDADGEEEEDEE